MTTPPPLPPPTPTRSREGPQSARSPEGSEPIRSLYVHVPFCHTICGYCDFYSEVLDKNAAPRLVDALLSELEGWTRTHAFSLETVFVGGGTPTTLPVGDLTRLLAAIRRLAGPVADRDESEFEFTVEANPATVTPEVARVLAEGGVNRVSIGAQSFNPGELRVLERIHRVEQVGETAANVRAAGIRRMNVDLIFAVPGQTMESWLKNLNAALALGTEHLSCYGLTFERGTPLFRQLESGEIRRADSELEADMFEATIDTLAAAGLRQYEISNYARPGAECRHNLVYWHNQPYLGIGPSAAGFVDGVRYKNVPDTAEYARAVRDGRSAIIERERLDRAGRARETAMLELRLIEGIDRRRFAARFEVDPVDFFADAVARHGEAGLLVVDDAAIRLTRRGLLLADSVMGDFLTSAVG